MISMVYRRSNWGSLWALLYLGGFLEIFTTELLFTISESVSPQASAALLDTHMV